VVALLMAKIIHDSFGLWIVEVFERKVSWIVTYQFGGIYWNILICDQIQASYEKYNG
jgi:hypothetical protein